MALAICPECGGKVSTTADACPHCGHTERFGSVDCPECGALVRDTAIKCPRCGFKLNLTPAEYAALVAKGKQAPKPYGCLFSILLVAATVAFMKFGCSR